MITGYYMPCVSRGGATQRKGRGRREGGGRKLTIRHIILIISQIITLLTLTDSIIGKRIRPTPSIKIIPLRVRNLKLERRIQLLARHRALGGDIADRLGGAEHAAGERIPQIIYPSNRSEPSTPRTQDNNHNPTTAEGNIHKDHSTSDCFVGVSWKELRSPHSTHC